MDWYDAGKDVGVGFIGTVLGWLGMAYKVKPDLTQAMKDIKTLKEQELMRVQNDINDLAKEVVKKEACIQCNKDICYRLDTLRDLSDKNYGETVEVRKDIKLLLMRK